MRWINTDGKRQNKGKGERVSDANEEEEEKKNLVSHYFATENMLLTSGRGD